MTPTPTDHPTVPTTRPIEVTRARSATAATFGLSGVLIGSYASRIPGLKTTLDLSDSGLGRALFAVAVGSLVSLQIAGRVISRKGSRRASFAGAVLSVLGIAALGSTDVLVVAAVAMFVMGAGFSLLDVAMNSQAVFVELDYGRPIMSSFHAVFSVGALAGAGLGALLAELEVGQQAQYVATGLVSAVLLAVAISAMRRHDPATTVPEPGAATPGGGAPPRRFGWVVAVFGGIAFAGMLSEGSAADWSGVHLRDTLGWTEGAATRGFLVFQVFMVIGRIAGDRVVASLGSRRVLIWSAAITAVGFGAGLAAEDAWAFVGGLAALGLGLALVVPVVFSTAANAAGDAGAAIARVSTLGYAGFLVGPPFIGQLAEWTSTTTALGVVPLLAVIVLVVVGFWVPHPERESRVGVSA